MSTFYDQFDGYVIPDHFRDHSKDQAQQKKVHYWTLTFTLTSGEVRNYYVKARNKQEALEKAKSLASTVELNILGEFKLLP